MTRESSNTRSWYIWALIAFIVGLVLGLIIAWGIWPVSYQNALPQDLRSVERDHYLRLVASSYAATGDLLAAQARLETWPTEDLAEAAGNLQERLLGSDPEAAADVRDLVAALNLRAAASRPAAQTATPFGGTSAWKSLCTSALWVLLLLLGVAGLAYLLSGGERPASGGSVRRLPARHRLPHPHPQRPRSHGRRRTSGRPRAINPFRRVGRRRVWGARATSMMAMMSSARSRLRSSRLARSPRPPRP